MDRTQTKDPFLTSLTLELQTWVLRGMHRLLKVNISVVILKSIKEWQSYGQDTKKDPILTFDL